MPLHALAAHFAKVADVYERGRPEYPPAVVGALAAELRLAPGATVLDLAAGTGKLTRALLDFGFDVVAVEPQAELRRVLEQRVGVERVRAGLAEAIPLPDASVDAVTVADAFHWFDQAAALAEIRRVVRPGGGLAVVANAPNWRDASWAHELGTLLSASRPKHPFFDGPAWREAVTAAPGWGTPWEVQVTTTQPTSPAQVVDHLASMSWVAAMDAEARASLLDRIEALVSGGQTPSQMPVHAQIGLAAVDGDHVQQPASA